jgi:hypothetical protein
VPLRFQREIGVITGLVGAAGGLGGFFCRRCSGVLKDLTGTYASGFVVLAVLCLWGMSLLVAVEWRVADDVGGVARDHSGGMTAQGRQKAKRQKAKGRNRLCVLGAPLWLWTALFVPIAAVAQSGAPSLPLAVAPLAIPGPYDSTIRLEIANRIRGEFVDWFATPPNGPNPNYRYNFLGNKFQLGVRVTRDPYELFVQFQDSTIANVPDNGVGVGSVYYANTHASLQNGAILRNAWVGTKRILDQPISGRAGRLLTATGSTCRRRRPTSTGSSTTASASD